MKILALTLIAIGIGVLLGVAMVSIRNLPTGKVNIRPRHTGLRRNSEKLPYGPSMTRKALLQVMDANERYIVGLEEDNETLKIGLNRKELDIGYQTQDLKSQVNAATSQSQRLQAEITMRNRRIEALELKIAELEKDRETVYV